LSSASTSLHATTYTLEPDYTQGVFRWNHLGFSSPAAQFSPKAQARWNLTRPIRRDRRERHDSAEHPEHRRAALDEDFRSTDFFDTARFPERDVQEHPRRKGVMKDHSRSLAASACME